MEITHSTRNNKKSLKFNIYFKIGAIFLIVILLLIPTSMIQGLISERESTQQMAIFEVSSKWADQQTISGPVLSIPYMRYVKEYNKKDSTNKIISMKEFIHFLPTSLQINGELIPEKRHRGIYEVVVYNSNLNISGTFDKLDFSNLGIDPKNILFNQAEFVVGINDLRGIEKQIQLNWNKDKLQFNPGVTSKDIISSGINTQVTVGDSDSSTYNFQLKLDLKGSQLLYFTPVGKVMDVNISSKWTNPSFNGAFLPDSKTLNENGFIANWNVLHLNRNFPQRWLNNQYSISQNNFGIDLLLPVDNYQKTYRTIKYAILFVVLTFMVFFFIEMLNKIFIHPIQYILVGIALIVFYTLLLSISEHLVFNLAFILAALLTLILIGGYVKAILKSNNLTVLILGILTILYSFIFVIIQLQDYALLIGSIGIFIILGLVMYFSRKIDWYNITLEDPKSDN